jgi:hypothetical protein
MEKQELGATLNTLMHLDRETARLYAEAIPTIGERDVAEELERNRRDHARHADECFHTLRDLDEAISDKPLAELADFIALEDDAVMNAGHLDTSLMALLIAEEAATLQYAEALQGSIPQPVRSTLLSHLVQDKAHVASVRDSLQIAADGGTSVRVGVGMSRGTS